jgi:hypothetical protein
MRIVPFVAIIALAAGTLGCNATQKTVGGAAVGGAVGGVGGALVAGPIGAVAGAAAGAGAGAYAMGPSDELR